MHIESLHDDLERLVDLFELEGVEILAIGVGDREDEGGNTLTDYSRWLTFP